MYLLAVILPIFFLNYVSMVQVGGAKYSVLLTRQGSTNNEYMYWRTQFSILATGSKIQYIMLDGL